MNLCRHQHVFLFCKKKCESTQEPDLCDITEFARIVFSRIYFAFLCPFFAVEVRSGMRPYAKMRIHEDYNNFFMSVVGRSCRGGRSEVNCKRERLRLPSRRTRAGANWSPPIRLRLFRSLSSVDLDSRLGFRSATLSRAPFSRRSILLRKISAIADSVTLLNTSQREKKRKRQIFSEHTESN